MLRKIIFSLFLLSTSLFAGDKIDLNGFWSGVGSAVDSWGGKYPECHIGYEFEQSPAEIKVLQAKYFCGTFEVTYDPYVLDVQGEDLIYLGQKVGTMFEGRLEATLPGEEFNTTLKLRIKDGILKFDETIRFPDNQFIWTEGDLKKEESL